MTGGGYTLLRDLDCPPRPGDLVVFSYFYHHGTDGDFPVRRGIIYRVMGFNWSRDQILVEDLDSHGLAHVSFWPDQTFVKRSTE